MFKRLPVYHPTAWFWSLPDGTIYSAQAGSVVGSNDPAYQQFLEDGGAPTPRNDGLSALLSDLRISAPSALPPALSLQARVSDAAQARLDAWAQEKEYDNLVSLCSYQTDDPNVTFATQGAMGRAKRSETWTFLQQLRSQIEQGGSLPSYESVITQLEAAVPLVW